MSSCRLALGFAFGCLVVSASASQTSKPAFTPITFEMEGRQFGGSDQVSAFGLSLSVPVVPHYSVVARLNAAGRLPNGAGGFDDELIVRHDSTLWPKLDFDLGFSDPDTMGRSRRLDGVYDVGWNDRVSGFDIRYGVKGLIGPDALTMLGLRLSHPLTSNAVGSIEVGFPLLGYNTFSSGTSASSRASVATLTIDCRQSAGIGGVRYGVGVTNAMGGTILTSMTPSIGSRFGLLVRASYEF